MTDIQEHVIELPTDETPWFDFISGLADKLSGWKNIVVYEPQPEISRSEAVEISAKHEAIMVIGLSGKEDPDEIQRALDTGEYYVD